jgi:hypothetical protein
MGKVKALVTEYGWEKAEYIISQIKHNKKVKILVRMVLNQ